MNLVGDAYDILGLPPGSDREAIKRAFRALARRFHPDVSSGAGDRERFIAARRAYEQLLDPEARAEIDRRRAVRTEPLGRGRGRISREEYEDLVDLLGSALRSFGPVRPPWRRDRGLSPAARPFWERGDAFGDRRFEGRVTGSGRVEVDALLTPAEAREGIVIPFRFQAGPRLVSEDVAVPAGVGSGDRLTYEIAVAPGVRLDLIVHVEVAR